MPNEAKTVKPYLTSGEKTKALALGLGVPVDYDEAGYYITDNARDVAQYGVSMMDNIQEGGKYRYGNGTVGQPAISWVSDKDTGWYYIADANIGFAFAGTKVWDYGKTSTVYTPIASTSGNPKLLTITAPAHTGVTASTELIDIDIDLSRSQALSGSLATQRSFVIRAPAFSGLSGAGTDEYATVAITSAPTGLPGAVRKSALWLQDGALTVGKDTTTPIYTPLLRLQGDMGGNTWLECRDNGNLQIALYASGISPSVVKWEYKANTEVQNTNVNLWFAQSNAATYVRADTTGASSRAGVQFKVSGATPNIWQIWGEASELRYGDSTPTTYFAATASGVKFTHAAVSTGTGTNFQWTGAAHTGMTASTEVIDVNWNLARTVQWATGAITTQRAFLIQAPTYAFVGASTITTAATLAISGAPTAGTNATITTAYALWVQGGTVKLAGRLDIDELRVGTATDTATSGDVAAGLVGAGRIFYDQSADEFTLYNSANAAFFAITPSVIRLGTPTASRLTFKPTIGEFEVTDTVGSNAFFTLQPGQAVYCQSQLSATSATHRSMGGYIIRGKYWDGAASQNADIQLDNEVSGNNVYSLRFLMGGSVRATLTRPGVLTANHQLRVGTATDTAADGDLVAGLTGAARLFYDQSAQVIYSYGSAGTIGAQISVVALTATVFNEQGADIDFRIEGDTDANMLFVDASSDRIGFKTAAPATAIHLASSGVRMDLTVAAVGGGLAPALGAAGNANTPTVAAQNSWATINLNGTTYYIAVWV